MYVYVLIVVVYRVARVRVTAAVEELVFVLKTVKDKKFGTLR